MKKPGVRRQMIESAEELRGMTGVVGNVGFGNTNEVRRTVEKRLENDKFFRKGTEFAVDVLEKNVEGVNRGEKKGISMEDG